VLRDGSGAPVSPFLDGKTSFRGIAACAWDVATGKDLGCSPPPLRHSVHFNPDARPCASTPRSIRLWQAARQLLRETKHLRTPLLPRMFSFLSANGKVAV